MADKLTIFECPVCGEVSVGDTTMIGKAFCIGEEDESHEPTQMENSR